MKRITNALLFLLPLALFACGASPEESNEPIPYQLTLLEDKVFMLDDETAFDQISAQYTVIDGKGYYSFFNRNNRNLYFYNYKTGELVRKVKLEKEGPNGVEYPYYATYWIHDLDNIFLNNLQSYYRVNGEGTVLKRINAHEIFSFTQPILYFDQSTSFINGMLYSHAKTLRPEKGDTSWLRVIYNFEAGTFQKQYLEEREIVSDYEAKSQRLREAAKAGGLSSISFQFAGDYEHLYATSPIQDSLYLFEGTALKDIYFAGDPNIESTDLEGYLTLTKTEKIANGGIYVGPNPVQPAYYTKIFNSPDKQFIYRILIHGSKAKINPETNREEPELTGASLIVFNTKTKRSGSVNLPLDLINLTPYTPDIFVTEQGIHFPVGMPNSENEKAYRVFKAEVL